MTPEQRVRRFIREQHLVSGGQKLVAAVSGGPDSVCMLDILVKLQDELDIKIHVAHLDHQLRGEESGADARYVAGLARRLNVPATIEPRDVKAYQKKHHTSLEEAAREVRYTFLAQVAGSAGAVLAAVGHTADDQVETVLMHLIRGSGTRGLRGLQPLSRWQSSGAGLTVIRPLLELSREETDAYCRDRGLAPRLDASNLSPAPMRNRIRHQLLPQLLGFNPRIADALLRTARIAADDMAFLDEEAARRWGETVLKQGGTVVIDRKGLAELPNALKRHLLRDSVEALLGNLKDIEARHIEDMLSALGKPAGKKISLPGGLTFAVDYGKYLLGPDPAALSPFPVLESESRLNIPGKTFLPGWEVEAVIADLTATGAGCGESDGFTACFDANKAGSRLTVRPREAGDWFQPLGMGQPKKLNRFMIDARVPQAWRRRIPIVCAPEQILWVVGWRIDERARVTRDTSTALCLEFKRS